MTHFLPMGQIIKFKLSNSTLSQQLIGNIAMRHTWAPGGGGKILHTHPTPTHNFQNRKKV